MSDLLYLLNGDSAVRKTTADSQRALREAQEEDERIKKRGLTIVGASLVAVVGATLWFTRRKDQIQKAENAKEQVNSLSRGEDVPDDVYQRISNELDSGNFDRGLWTRLYAQSEGEEVATRVAYIKARALQLNKQRLGNQ